MIRCPFLLVATVCCLAGCCDTAPTSRRFVPTSSVVPVEPQPQTAWEFRSAEQQGYLVAATGRGPAYGWADQPIHLTDGEALHVLRVDARTGEVLVKRLENGSPARVTLDGVEVRATTFGR